MGCDATWFGFEGAVVNGWPVDLIKISGERLLYEPLRIDAMRNPEENVFKRRNSGWMAWRDEAPFDMERP